MTDTLIPLDVRCECRGRPRIRLRVSVTGLVALRAALNSHATDLKPDTMFQTYVCDGCRARREITFRDLNLAA